MPTSRYLFGVLLGAVAVAQLFAQGRPQPGVASKLPAPQLFENRLEIRVVGLRYAEEWHMFGDMPGMPSAKPKQGEVLLVVAFEVRDPKTRKLDTDASFGAFGLTDLAGATYAASVESTDLREMAFSVPPGTKPKAARIGGLTFEIAGIPVSAKKS